MFTSSKNRPSLSFSLSLSLSLSLGSVFNQKSGTRKKNNAFLSLRLLELSISAFYTARASRHARTRAHPLALSFFLFLLSSTKKEEDEDVRMMMMSINFYSRRPLSKKNKKNRPSLLSGSGPTRRFFTKTKNTQKTHTPKKFSRCLPPQTERQESSFWRRAASF